VKSNLRADLRRAADRSIERSLDFLSAFRNGHRVPC